MGSSESSEKNKKEIALVKKLTDSSKFGEFDQLFLRHDDDKDGLLNELEFINSMNTFKNIRPDQVDLIEELKNEIRIDSQNALNNDEFRKLMYNCFEKQDISEKVIEVFRIFDKNNQAELSTEEIMHCFNKLGLNMEISDVELLFEEATNDKKGKLYFEEFVKIMIGKQYYRHKGESYDF